VFRRFDSGNHQIAWRTEEHKKPPRLGADGQESLAAAPRQAGNPGQRRALSLAAMQIEQVSGQSSQWDNTKDGGGPGNAPEIK